MSFKHTMKVFISVLMLLSVLYFFGGGKKIARRLKKRKEVYSKVSMERADDIRKYIDMLKNIKELEAIRENYNNTRIYVFLILIAVIMVYVFQFFQSIVVFGRCSFRIYNRISF